ncbi:spore maturation protein [Oceanirhabdus sp. W0125-5]|uniref:spore maturation protein n=1 Tax=Oceanirhabdus sp. W0125-5 TaxID=2999116 RepID=UPI0022F313E4|nr:nucleoside recognition domain-containing protein [Oceanirhabdus sp. W0125-5]WBW98284.1 spore maturation protein [Oceanirhabdus sp. W0125-5]
MKGFMLFIPIVILFILIYGIIKGVKVYEVFVEGARDGLKITYRIFPYLLAMIFAVTLVRTSGMMNIIEKILSPFTYILGIPKEIMPLVLIKPISGSGALGTLTEIINTFGVDSYIGICAAVVMGTTETIFYTISIYFGSVKIKKIRHTLWAVLLADIAAVIAAVNIVKIFLK